MVNFRDPAVIAQDYLALTKFWHALAGLYFWEFVTTLDYEWSVIRGHRPYRWTIWIYSVTRGGTLMVVILSLVGMDATAQYNCVAENVFRIISGYLSFSAALLLMVLRTYVLFCISGDTTIFPSQLIMGTISIAIWKGKKSIIVIATSVWVTNLGSLIQRLARIRASWVPAMGICVVDNISGTRLNMIATLITDIVLLLLMLIGLLRLGFYKRDALDLGRLMWRQGLIWLLLATIAEVPPVVFICLNLNDPFNYMFQTPAVITMTIAATRIHRFLAEFEYLRTIPIKAIVHPRRPIEFLGSLIH